MLKKNNNYKQLAASICAEVQSTLSAQLEIDAAENGLVGKIEKLLAANDADDSAPEFRNVTIVMSDIRGFTSLVETLPAMTMMELLNRYFSHMTDVVMQHGGTIDNLMGDSMMVLFGAPHAGADDVARAISCAVDMQRAMSEFNQQNSELGLPDMYMGIGINSGNVIVGALGSDYHREYAVVGDAVNITSRIEAQSLRGQVLMSEITYGMAKSFVQVGEPNKVMVKGKRDALCLYDLIAITKPKAITVPRREVRKSPRVAVNMRCYFYQLVGKLVDGEAFQGEVIDLGYNGLLMQSPIELEPLSEIKMAVSLQLLGTDTTDIYARVVKVDKAEDGILCGLEFTSIDDVGQQAIKQFVDNQLNQP